LIEHFYHAETDTYLIFLFTGVTTTNADIWPGGHGVAGW
jgi:hypothetical protein